MKLRVNAEDKPAQKVFDYQLDLDPDFENDRFDLRYGGSG